MGLFHRKIDPIEMEERRLRAATADMWIFDALPPRIRQVLRTTAVAFKCDLVRDDLLALRRAVIGETDAEIIEAAVIWVAQREQRWLESASIDHLRAHGVELPHIAAEATIERGDGPPLRRPNPRFTKDLHPCRNAPRKRRPRQW